MGDYSMMQDTKRDKLVIALPYGSDLMSDEDMEIVLPIVQYLMERKKDEE